MMATKAVKPTGIMAEHAKIRASRGELLPMLKQIELDEFGPDEDRRTDIIHPSELCKADCCPRAVTMRILGQKLPDEKFNFVLENIFAEGNEIHAKWQRRMRKTGKLWGRWECSLRGRHFFTGLSSDLPGNGDPGHIGVNCLWKYREVSLSAENTHLMTGHADGAMLDFLIEIKSVGVGTLRFEAPILLAKHQVTTRQGKKIYDLDALWKDLKRPFTTHVRQATLYLFMAREMGLPFTRMIFLYEFKPNQQVKEFSIELSEEILAELLATADTIKQGVDSGVLPPCPHGGCKQCQEGAEGDGKAGKQARGVSAHGRRRSARSVDAGGAGDTDVPVGETATRRSTRRSARSDRAAGQRADDAVPPGERLGEVPGAPAQRRTGRRTARRSTGSADRGA
jgi:hypothetical protein